MVSLGVVLHFNGFLIYQRGNKRQVGSHLGGVFLFVLIMKGIDFTYPDLLGCGLIAKFQIPYTLGVMMGERVTRFNGTLKTFLLLLVLVILYMCLFRYYGWDTSTLPLPVPTLFNKGLYFLLTIMLGCIGSLFCIYLFRWIGDVNIFCLGKIGTETLGIYTLHFIFINLLLFADLYVSNASSFFRTIIYTIIVLAVCHFIILTIHKNSVASHLLLGENR